MTRTTAWVAAFAAVAWMVPSAAVAQQAGNPNDPWCRDEGNHDRGHYCEVREMTLPPLGGVLTVNAKPNGGIKIVGSNRRDVQVRAKVTAQAATNDQAQALVRDVTVQTGGSIQAEGPAMGEDRNWSVSYEISVPSDQPLSLASTNGGISISNIRAQADFRTQNGGISLTNVAGTFKGRTQNGGVQVSLQGQHWDGEGLDVQTQNGGITVTVPEGFSAHVETSTVNGRISTDFPVTVSGEMDRRHLTADINGGGATLKLTTTNGGVSIRKR
jgi:hypothetical protein